MGRSSIRARLLISSLCTLAALQEPASADFLNPLSFTSLGTLDLVAGAYTFDTSTQTLTDSGSNVLFTGTTTTQASSFNPTIAVFDFDSIKLAAGAVVTVTGANPLALLSRSSITISGTISANGGAGGNGTVSSSGAGGKGAAGGADGGNGTGGVGEHGQGPGGGPSTNAGLSNESFGAGGGFGGRGGHPLNPPYDHYGPTYGDLTQALEAGSGGSGAGANFFSYGGGGGGGAGAIEFGALSSIVVTPTGEVHADGGAGGGENIIGYLGGGGSGGGLLFHAPTIALELFSDVTALGYFSGGGGRIHFATTTATIDNHTSGLSVAPSLYGEEGVISYGFLSVQPVPEPGSLTLLALGLVSFGGIAWRHGRLARPIK